MKRLALILALTAAAHAENWPQFRGGSGLGLSGGGGGLGFAENRALPLKWNGKTGENVAWRAALPKSDNPWSSPVVWGDRVFVTCVQNQPLGHHVLCFATSDGKPLWDTEVPPGTLLLKDMRGGYGA